MLRPSRLGLALATTLAAGSLLVGGGLASAAPTVGCDQAKAALAKAEAGKDQAAISRAQALVDASCATTAPTTKPSPAPGDTPAGGGDQKPPKDGPRPPVGDGGPGRPGGDDQDGDDHEGQGPGEAEGPAPVLSCSDFATQAEAQKYLDYALPKDRQARLDRLDRDHDGKACDSRADTGGSKLPAKVDPSTVVDQTADDGSEATTSGEQVKDVPEGSVDTGSAQ